MIRVFFPGDTWVDLPEETPADPYGPPVEDEKPPTLEWTRDRGFGVALVLLRGTWLAGRVESWAAEAKRLRSERDAAEKRIADMRAWAIEIAEGQSDSPEGRRVAGDFRAVVYRIDEKEG